VEVRLYGPDLDRLAELGESMRALLAEIPEVTHTRSDLSDTLQKVELDVDEEQARLAGLDHSAIARQMEASLDGVVGGSILEETEELPVRVRLANADRGRADRAASLDLLSGTAGAGGAPAFLPADALAEFRPVWARATIPHFNGVRMNEVQAYVQAGVLPDQALEAFQRRLAESGFEMPPGYRMEFGGEASKRDDAVGNLFSSVGILIVLMIATLVLSFGSFRMTGIIGGVAVLAVGLGLGSLWLFGYPFGFMAIIGTMGLIGVAINDSIVVLAALREDERARIGDVDGIVEVVNHATRHVLSTTMTTVAGFLPLILAGGQFWPPLAVAISGGVAGATAIALLSVPAAYRMAMCRESLRGKTVSEEQRDVDTMALSAPDTVRMSGVEADDAPADFGASHARHPAAAN
jgi:multidrug efflux pump subunit AcrB